MEYKNRDLRLLGEVFCIMQDICALEERRQWEKDRMVNITQHIRPMPFGGGGAGGLESAFEKLSQIEERHEKQCAGYVRKLRRAEKALNSIQNPKIRTFVTLKYMLLASDEEVRHRLNISRRDLAGMKAAVEQAANLAHVTWKES